MSVMWMLSLEKIKTYLLLLLFIYLLLLGQKYSLVSVETSKEAFCQKEEIHDLVF